jgi:hypothetical protein
VLTWIFVGLWPKKKANMPADDLKKLAAVFDTVEDPILSMKSRSVKQGAEGAIALAYLHGEEVDWDKVSSSCGRPLSELLGFFEKAKKYAPGIMSIITPSAASSTSTPASLTPATSTLMTHKYRVSQQSSREVLPKFIDLTQGEPKNICKP